MLFPLHQYILAGSLFKAASVQHLQIAHTTVVAVNVTLAFILGKKDGIEYLGQVNMLAITAILLSIPLITINKYLHLDNTYINSFYLGMITTFIIIEYIRRLKFARIIPGYRSIVIINILSILSMLVYFIFKSACSL